MALFSFVEVVSSGTSMLMLESTAVNDTGKISHADLCLKKQKNKVKILKN